MIGSTAGESQRIIGLRDVAQSDTSLQRSCVMNSSGFGDKFACVSVGLRCLRLLLLFVPALCLLACLSGAVSAHARPSPMQVAHNSGDTGVLLPVQRAPVAAWEIRCRTRVGYRVPWGGGTKGGVCRPKICVLSQRWR